MKLYGNVGSGALRYQQYLASAKWLPLPWKLEKSLTLSLWEKHQSSIFLRNIRPNSKKHHEYVTWHKSMLQLLLEFSKWTPLPWKQQKYQKISKWSKLNETYNRWQLTIGDKTLDLRISKMAAVAMETAKMWMIEKWSKFDENLQKNTFLCLCVHWLFKLSKRLQFRGNVGRVPSAIACNGKSSCSWRCSWFVRRRWPNFFL